VDFNLWSLVSWINLMCGSLCIVRASSWIPGRLELMHLVFQVIILSGEVWWLSLFVLVFRLGIVWVVSWVGW
jgi:hypothetical protein